MQSHRSLDQLDRLIQDFGGSSEPFQRKLGTSEALLEHLQAARRYLLGVSPGEYRSSLQMAQSSLFSIADGATRAQVKAMLAGLLV